MKNTEYNAPLIKVQLVKLEAEIVSASIVTGGNGSKPLIEEEVELVSKETWPIDLN